MRTIQVVNVRWYNATAWYGVTLARCFQKHGHDSMVVGLKDTAPLREAAALGLPTLALPLNSLNPLEVAQGYAGIKALLKEFRPHVVNCHRGEAFISWAMLKKIYGFKLIRTRGDQRLPKNSCINRYLHKHVADGVIATNTAMAQYFRAVLGVPAAKVHMLIGGVDTHRFAPDATARQRIRTAAGYGEQDIVIGLLGRMDRVKGIAQTIAALAQAVHRMGMDRLRLVCIGFDSQHNQDEVYRWAQEAGVEGKVLVTGKVDQPQEWINALDLGVVASLGSEAIARAALEIMACGVPLVSSRVGVMPDLLPQEYLFPPGDINAMATLFSRVTDPVWRQSLQEWCKTTIYSSTGHKTGLTLEDFYRQTLAVYTQ